jgi:cation-transporting ATPase 13A1
VNYIRFELFIGDTVAPTVPAGSKLQVHIRRRFQFSSALKRMSTVSTLPNGRGLIAVKGAPETIKQFLDVVPAHYDDTYKTFTRKGSRVLALAMKEVEPMNTDRACSYSSLSVQSTYRFLVDQ